MNVPGFADARFGPVRECLAGIVAAQPGTGAAFAAWHDGQLVVDLWGGYADAERRRPWAADSLVQPYSVSKPFAAVCALRLVEDGRLDLDAPVQRYWPEFRAAATVRHVLSHQAGVVTIDRQVPTEAFYDWDYLCRLLAAQQPSWPPGTAHGESALFYGHLVGELVRRVDGRTVGRFLREDICGPFGIDFAFGLDPAQQARAVDITGLDDSFRAAGEARPAAAVPACHRQPARRAGRRCRQQRRLAGRGDPRDQRARDGPGGGRFLPGAGQQTSAEPRDARRSGHPAVLRPGPRVRRGQRVGTRLRRQRRRLRDGRVGRKLRGREHGRRLHGRLRHRQRRRPRPGRGGGERVPGVPRDPALAADGDPPLPG